MSSSTTSESKLATAKTVISTVGSIAATAMVARSIARDYLPPEIQDYFYQGLQNVIRYFSNQLTIVIDEYDGLATNEIYEAASLYLGSKISPQTRRLKAIKPDKEHAIQLAMERNEEVVESYKGIQFKWTWICHQMQHVSTYYNPYDMSSSTRSESRLFELTFHKKHKETALNFYLPFILEQAASKKNETKTLKIFTVDGENMYSGRTDSWKSVNLDHPSTFETLAMDSDLKEMVLKDLERFVKRKDKYRKVGKAWKRGYLLYGPPGTGKSSLIAAMANYLNFDIYDLELTELKRNTELRKLLIATANRSISVVEDIDCTIELQDRYNSQARVSQESGFYNRDESKVTLSGFLNFIDGLWSSIGDERIIIFTTNHKDKLDPALLRPGRMDVHIHMSYCTPCGFKLLAANYLGVDDHELFGEIEELVKLTEVTPAEVAEQLMKSDDAYVSLSGLVDFLHVKGKENEEAKSKKALEEAEVVLKEKEKQHKDDSCKKETENSGIAPNKIINCHCCCNKGYIQEV